MKCRLCGHPDLALLVDFREMPIGHRLRRQKDDADPRFPVRFHLCGNCGLLQIVEPINPEILYSNADAYSTAFQKPAHIPDLINSMVARRDPGTLLEVGCNDGSFLAALRERGFERPVGIEPNKPVAELGRRQGLDIRTDFFEPGTVEEIKRHNGGGFDFIVSRHVLEHVEGIEEFLRTVWQGLAAGGLFVLELPFVEAGFDCANPSILWEEHVNYLTEPLIERLLALSGFTVLDRRHYSFGGGTIAFIARRDDTAVPVTFASADWAGVGLGKAYYDHFAKGLDSYRRSLVALVAAYRAAGWRIAVYGAAPRSVTVVNSCAIGNQIDMVIDDRAEIQRRYMPGTDHTVVGFDAVDAASGPILFLLGVGNENEFKVKRKIRAKIGSEPRTASLFAPRDSHRSFSQALASLKA